jgi:hypothetical protein
LQSARRSLIARPFPLRASWPATVIRVVGSFTLLYLASQVLLYSAEAAIVRRAKLWPRALDI